MKRTLIAVCVLLIFSAQADAQRKEPFFMRDAVGVKSYPAAPRLAERAAMVAASVLPAAETTVPEEIVAIREWNASGREPARNGFKRTLPDLIELKGSALSAAKAGVSGAGRGVAARTDHGTVVWSTVVTVEKAHRLRLHLENCVLPEGAVLWVYGAGEVPVAFGRELLDELSGCLLRLREPLQLEVASNCAPCALGVDGALAVTYGSISQWIDPTGSTPVCTQNATTMCLADNRFEVTAAWQTGNNSGAGQAVRLTSDTGYFWFFGSSNVEAVIKVLNACPLNQKYWVFAGGLTNVKVTLTVRDTKTGAVKTYINPLNTPFAPIEDTSAFATCP